MLMKNIIENVVSEYGEKPATIYNDRVHTYNEFYTRMNKVSHALFNMKFYKGDRIAILLNNRPEYFELYFGIFNMGGIAVPLNTRLSPPELIYIINHSGANTIVYEDKFEDTIQSIIDDLPAIKNIITVGEKVNDHAQSYEMLLAEASGDDMEAEVDEDDIAFLCYTSGTTGNPKGAMITHKNMTQMCSYQLIELPRYRNYVGMCLFPFFHIGVMMGLNKVAMGMTVVFSDFVIEDVARLIEKHQINDLDITATQLRFFVNDPVVKNYNLRSLKTVSTGGGFSSADTVTKLFDMFEENDDIRLANIYGMTENTAHVMSNIITPETLDYEIEQMNSLPHIEASGLGAGRPIYGMRVKIVDKKGNEVGVNEIGELLVKGDTVMKGYWQEPDKTNEAVKDGWYYTGDVAVRLESGDYFIVDRKKDMIVTGDENVYSAEVENVIQTHHGITEVAVIGTPDERYGEIVTAFIVPKDHQLTQDEVRQFLRGRIAGYKIPKKVFFIEQLPRNAAGKIMKHKLRAQVNEFVFD